MRTNVWLTVENNLAVSWWQWYQWFRGDREGPEPEISEWDKRALQKVTDIPWSAKAFKKATIPQLAPKDQWRLWNLYDIKVPEWIDAGYNKHGRAEEGGNLGVAGVWEWKETDSICKYNDHNGEYPWKPRQVVLFMPDECVNRDQDGNCDSYESASQITDVILLMDQPLRYFPEQP